MMRCHKYLCACVCVWATRHMYACVCRALMCFRVLDRKSNQLLNNITTHTVDAGQRTRSSVWSRWHDGREANTVCYCMYVLVRLLCILYIFYLFFLYYLYKNLSSLIIGKRGKLLQEIEWEQHAFDVLSFTVSWLWDMWSAVSCVCAGVSVLNGHISSSQSLAPCTARFPTYFSSVFVHYFIWFSSLFPALHVHNSCTHPSHCRLYQIVSGNLASIQKRIVPRTHKHTCRWWSAEIFQCDLPNKEGVHKVMYPLHWYECI